MGSTCLVSAGTLLLALLAAPEVSAQAKLTATVEESGLIRLSRGTTALATIELNAHGPEWKHAPQTDATAKVTDLPDRAGKQAVGELPIPNADGGAIRFTETIRTIAQGLRLEYDLEATAAMRLNGLQLSLVLPVETYAGHEVVVSRLEADPEIIGLPLEPREQGFQLWSGEGAKIEVAKDAEGAVTVELRAPTDVVVQDLRQWEQQVFEVRFPAIMEDQGREVTPDDRFHLDLTVTFPESITLAGP
jgi:hypothetical protein